MSEFFMIERLGLVQSSIVNLRAATISDVPLIYSLRTSPGGAFLNSISLDISDQYVYFDKYLERHVAGKEIYYIIHDLKIGNDVGIVRLTRIDEEYAFSWESLIIRPGCTPGVAIDVHATIYGLGFNVLKRQLCGPWEIKKNNEHMLRIHQLMGVASAVGERDNCWLYSAKREDFVKREKYFTSRGFGRIDYATFNIRHMG